MIQGFSEFLQCLSTAPWQCPNRKSPICEAHFG